MADLKNMLLEAAGRKNSPVRKLQKLLNTRMKKHEDASFSDNGSDSKEEDSDKGVGKGNKRPTTIASDVPLKKRLELEISKRGNNNNISNEDKNKGGEGNGSKDEGGADSSEESEDAGNDLYKNEDDKKRLAKMTELEREMILSERATEKGDKVYPDLEVVFVISEEESLFNALSKTVELLEGNTALISQYYYGCIFHELLAFQLACRCAPSERSSENVKSIDMIGFAKSAVSVLNNDELAIDEVENGSLIVNQMDCDYLHVDVDQIFFPVPSPVKASIFEIFARQNTSESEIDVTTSIKNFVKSNYGFPTDCRTEFIYADNSKAIFNKLVLCCNREGGTLCFPAGSNGNYVSSATFLKADIVTVPTDAGVGFKFTEKTLSGVLGTVKNPWVYISGPTINPTGLVYSNKEIGEILGTCARFGARVIIDTSSSGLEFDCKGWGGWDLEGCLSNLNSSIKSSFCVSLLGGLSLKMLNGVLRLGFVILNQSDLVDSFYSYPGLSKPHSTVRYATKKLLDLREQKSSILSDAIVEHTQILRSRSARLKEVLEKNGWDVLESCAGVSVVAKPSAYLKKTIKIKLSSKGEVSQGDAATEITLDDSNIRNAILEATGLCINSGSWTGIPGYCRFNIALEENDFKKALDCILKFREVALD